MSEIVDEFPGSARGDNYPWDEWFDGQIRKLTKGEDYDCLTASFSNAAYNARKRRGVEVRISVRGDIVYIQAAIEEGKP